MLDHLSIQCADVHASAAFYDAGARRAGGTRVMDFGEATGFAPRASPGIRIGPQTAGEGFRESPRVSGLANCPKSSGVGASDRILRHDKYYHEV